jgi:hypothetical protein
MCVSMYQVEAVPSQVTVDSRATHVCLGDVTGDSWATQKIYVYIHVPGYLCQVEAVPS